MTMSGYHTWGGLGSFEVFHADGKLGCLESEKGWYWWPCFPGCLPDGDLVGPFASDIEAFLDAQELDHA